MSFSDLLGLAEDCGRALLSRGLERGDRVALAIVEPWDFIPVILGCMRAGLVPVPVYPPSPTAKFAAYGDLLGGILQSSGARALVGSEWIIGLLRSLLSQHAGAQASKLQLLDARQLRTRTNSTLPELDSFSPDDLAFLQYTSGSTSAPRGVMVSHRNLTANANAIMNGGLEVHQHTDRDVVLSWVPLYHDMGLIGFVFSPILTECTSVFIPTLDFVKRPRIWLESVSKYRATVTFAPNFAFALATRDPPREAIDLSCLRVAGCGAEPIDPTTLRTFIERYQPSGLRPECVMPCYGLAEATLGVTFSSWRKGMQTLKVDRAVYERERSIATDPTSSLEWASCGEPLLDTQVAVRDEAGQALPEGKVGVVHVQGLGVTQGYFGQPQASARVWGPNGLDTGDLGFIWENQLFITGRKKDLIIINGRNHDPQVFERAAFAVPGIRKGNVIAFSVPGPQTEELVIVAETALPTAQLPATEGLIREAVQTALQVKVSRVLLLPPGAIPKTSSGKLQRSRARDLYLRDELRVSRLSLSLRKLRFGFRFAVAGAASRLRTRLSRRSQPGGEE